MAHNTVQFQKGLSERQFGELYGSEDRCRAALFAWRWPKGFVCPRCGGEHRSQIKRRKLYQCSRCRHQVSLTSGTIFHSTNLPLTIWFQAMYLITQSKKGISSLELARRLNDKRPTRDQQTISDQQKI
jgi:transposase-like protein